MRTVETVTLMNGMKMPMVGNGNNYVWEKLTINTMAL